MEAFYARIRGFDAGVVGFHLRVGSVHGRVGASHARVEGQGPRVGREVFCRVSRYRCFRRVRSPTSSPLLQQRPKLRLLKMGVAGQCRADSFILHHHERNAIRERPILVPAVAKKLLARIEKLARGRDDRDARLLMDPIVEPREHTAIRRLTKRVTQEGRPDKATSSSVLSAFPRRANAINDSLGQTATRSVCLLPQPTLTGKLAPQFAKRAKTKAGGGTT